jgi:hypothetical protein
MSELGVTAMRKAGIAVTEEPYPQGEAGIARSVAEVKAKIQASIKDARLRGWAGQTLIDAGRPKSVRGKFEALLNGVRKQTVYAPDPLGTDYMVTAAGTLCLQPGLCVPAADCDDLTIALVSAAITVGLDAYVIKQNFKTQRMQHVLAAVRDPSDGTFIYADPSTSLPIGQRTPGASEEIIDPLAGFTPVIVGVGAVWDGAEWRGNITGVGGSEWHEVADDGALRRYGKARLTATLGAPVVEQLEDGRAVMFVEEDRNVRIYTLGDTTWQLVTPVQTTQQTPYVAGLRYRVQLFAGTDKDAANIQQRFVDGGWYVESIVPDMTVQGGAAGFRAWLLQGIPRQSGNLSASPNVDPQVINMWVQSSTPQVTPQRQPPDMPIPKVGPPAPDGGALGWWVAGLAVAGVTGYGLYKLSKVRHVAKRLR